METLLVRLKPYDPRRKFVLRRFAYAGIHFHVTRGWERVPKDVADYLKNVRQLEFDPYSPAAFDVCTEEEATALEARERELAGVRRTALDAIPLSAPRQGAVTTADLRAGGGEEEAEQDPARARGGRRGEARR